MRALVKTKGEVGLWPTEAPQPRLGTNDLLIKIKKTAICGTDVHIWKWDDWSKKTVPLGLIIGHEYMGEVCEVGASVRGFAVGDRVSGEGHITCGHCRNCRAGSRHLCRNTTGVGVEVNGAFAEYLVLPAGNAYKIPDEIDDELGAVLDPFGNAVHTALSFNLVGEDVLITGAGPIGCMAASVARHVGARHVVVTDVNPYRLDLASKLGATRVVDPTKEDLEDVMSELGMREGFDAGLEMSGNPSAFSQMLSVMNHGGHVAMLGVFSDKVAIDWQQVIFKGLRIKGIYGREMFETWYKMGSMLQSGLNLQPIITHRMPASEYERGFELMLSGQSGKVILDWQDSAKLP